MLQPYAASQPRNPDLPGHETTVSNGTTGTRASGAGATAMLRSRSELGLERPGIRVPLVTMADLAGTRRIFISDANFYLESTHEIRNLAVFDTDIAFQVSCNLGRVEIRAVPAPGHELPPLLLSEGDQGPMAPGQPSPDGSRTFEVPCGASIGLTWNPRRLDV